jgi:hypothetical protein
MLDAVFRFFKKHSSTRVQTAQLHDLVQAPGVNPSTTSIRAASSPVFEP